MPIYLRLIWRSAAACRAPAWLQTAPVRAAPFELKLSLAARSPPWVSALAAKSDIREPDRHFFSIAANRRSHGLENSGCVCHGEAEITGGVHEPARCR